MHHQQFRAVLLAIVAICLGLPRSTPAPVPPSSITFQKELTGFNASQGNFITPTHSGAMFFGGNVLKGNNSIDTFLAKLNPTSAALFWSIAFHTGINYYLFWGERDGNDGIVACGGANVFHQPTLGTDPEGSIISSLLIRLTNSGTVTFMKRFHFADEVSPGGFFNYVVPTSDGGALAGGTYAVDGGGFRSSIVKLSACGDLDYAWSIGAGTGSNSDFSSVQGLLERSTDYFVMIQNKPDTNGLTWTYSFVRLDKTTGAVLGVTSYNAPEPFAVVHAASTKDGGIIITAGRWFGMGLLKLDRNLDLQWANEYDDVGPANLNPIPWVTREAVDGSFITAGFFESEAINVGVLLRVTHDGSTVLGARAYGGNYVDTVLNAHTWVPVNVGATTFVSGTFSGPDNIQRARLLRVDTETLGFQDRCIETPYFPRRYPVTKVHLLLSNPVFTPANAEVTSQTYTAYQTGSFVDACL